MSRLTNQMGLREATVDILKQNKVFTILDFLQEDAEKLSAFCNLNFKDVLEARHNFIHSYAALPISGTSVYEKLLTSSALIQTGIHSLDALLQGGFLTGTVLEVCGPSGEGKTQLCLSISAHVAACLKQRVKYVNTGADFPTTRLHDIIKQKSALQEECKAALDQIELTQVKSIYELLQFLHQLRTSITSQDSATPRLVIVDFMPALYFPFMGSSGSQGFGLLSQAMSMMKSLATEYHILFIEVNLASTFVETSTCEEVIEYEGRDTRQFQQDATTGEVRPKDITTSDVRPMLGKFWLHAPDTRLLINRLNNDAPQRLVRVVKSTYLPIGSSCIVTVSQQGVI